MRKQLLLVALCLTLVGCGEATKQGQEAIDAFKSMKSTASGHVLKAKSYFGDAIEFGKSLKTGIPALIEGTKRRFDQVQSGILMLRDAKDLIEGGISPDEEENEEAENE